MVITTKRKYASQNVYDALQNRFHYIFKEFDNIFVSFSGGKDSGLLLNLILDFQKKYYPKKKIGVFHQDFEAQYTLTTEYVERTFARIENEVEPYWVCLPMATRTALSNYEMFWYPWDDTKEDLWIRPMPDHPYVINMKNNPMTTYHYRMHQEELAKQFGRWYRISHGDNKTVCLLGIRAEESMQRYSGILNRKYGYDNTCWISRQFKNVWCASPMYDWSIYDVWHANYVFSYDYNRLYDLYYMSGLKLDQMPGAGAAGGMGAGCAAFLGAGLRPGIEAVLDMVDFDRCLEGADLVITGEGRLDAQSLQGKVISGVAKRTQPRGIPLLAIVGCIGDGAEAAYARGVTAMFSINREAEAFPQSAPKSADHYRRTLEDVLRLVRALS